MTDAKHPTSSPSHAASAKHPEKAHASPSSSIDLLDNQTVSYTVYGVLDERQLDIAHLADITVSSDKPEVCEVDKPAGATFKMHGRSPGTAEIEITATWKDGSAGPFSSVLKATVSTSTPKGIVAVAAIPINR